MDIKKLKKLYEEYKKIGQPKGYDEGGKVPEHNKKNLKKLNDSFGKFLEEESSEKGYDEGGPVRAPSPQEFSSATMEGFESPSQSTSTFIPSDEKTPPSSSAKNLDKNSSSDEAAKRAAIRKSYGYDDSGNQVSGYSKGGKVKGYADGTDEGVPVQAEDSQKMDLGDIPINAAPADELPDYTAEEADAKKVVDQKQALNDEAGQDEEEQPKEESKASDKEDRKPASQDEEKDETEIEEPTDKEQADIDQSGFSGKAEGITPPPSQQDQLADAMRQRDENIALQNMQKGAARIGAGLLKTNPAQSLASIGENDKYVNLPVEDYAAKVANQQNDPTSPMSKVVSQYLTQKGFNLPPGTSAADAFKVMPFLQKDNALKVQLQKVMMQQGGAQQRTELTNKTKSDIAEANRQAENQRAQAKNAIEQQKANAQTSSAESNKELKSQASQDRALAQSKTMLESARGNPAAAQAEKDLYATSKIDSLFKLYPDPNKIPQAQVNLALQEIAKVATGGVPTGHEMDALQPGTPESKLQQLYGKLQNQPTPANLGDYLNEFKKYTGALKGDAQKVIQDKYGRIIESSKKQLGDDNYNSLKDQYLNRFNSPEVHPQDSQALDWAKKNPNDPRSAQILKINGIQ
jgi:hypothetical protein